MTAFLRALRALGPIDLRNIRRDGLLLTLLLVLAGMTAAFRFGIPPLTAWLQTEFSFDLVPYYPLIMSTLVVLAPSIVGIVVGFMLLDERDERTLTALAVTPLPPETYIAYRLVVPMAVGFIATLIAFPLAGLMPIAFTDLIAVTAVSTLTAPVSALVIGSLASNKVAGFAVQKTLSNIQSLPIIAWFVDPPWHWLFAVLPTFWPFKMVWAGAEGQPMALYGVMGVIANAAAIWLLVRRFRTIQKRMA